MSRYVCDVDMTGVSSRDEVSFICYRTLIIPQCVEGLESKSRAEPASRNGFNSIRINFGICEHSYCFSI
ncbi:unnamed protein product [Bursaphelenchus okinawaensis]|uniref:Uncharacterized protein n=1 Tax=Bursaphelenchus okinawaensis TaxID=465554 RepID=A0A811L9M5_9BILA|nr:unnamed protein product [Bursaphelenchus okinawaensis]CAG9119849.1 unnamed protein product [Bursaphelenchus okinawaensis]